MKSRLLFILLCLAIPICSAIAATIQVHMRISGVNAVSDKNQDGQAPGATAGVGSGCDCDLTTYNYCLGDTITSEVGADPVSITFSSNVYCGKFASQSSSWVSPTTPGGTVTISSSYPSIVGDDTTLRNGIAVNPNNSNYSDLDGRLGDGNTALSLPHAINTTTTPITSLVKADSYNDSGSCKAEFNGYQRYCFQSYDIFTVLDDVPAGYGANHLRPAVFGSTKTLHATTDFDLTRLPDIDQQSRPSGTFSPEFTMQNALSRLAAPKIDWMSDWPNTESFKGIDNWYGLDTAYSPGHYGPMWEAMSWLYVDVSDFGASDSDKTLLAYRALELGMDVLQAVLQTNLDWLYPPAGGHNPGRYGLALFAAVMQSNTTDLTNLLAELASAGGSHHFAELGQIVTNNGSYPVYGANNITGGKSFSSCIVQANSVMADPSGETDVQDYYYLDDPAYPGDDCTTRTSGAYQGISAPIFTTQAMFIYMIPELKAVADTELLTYVDRLIQQGVINYVDNIPANGTQYQAIMPRCSGGANDGLIAFSNTDDCPGGSITNKYTNFSSSSYNTVFGVMMYEQLRSCLLTSTCTGQ